MALVAQAVPPFDPAGVANVGNGAGLQFITGQCLSDADCGSGCCASPTGICSGPGASTQAGKTGCGFGSSVSGAPPVAAPPAPSAPVTGTATAGGPPFDINGAKNVGNGAGGQFITGQCLSNADCGSGCCAGPSGICSGPGASTQAGKTGCGFSSSASGGLAASPAPVAAAPVAAAPPAVNAATTPFAGGPPFDINGAKNVGNGAAGQFITGQCLSDADCGSGCCAGPSGICSGPGASTQAGKTGCGFSSTGASTAALAPVAAPVGVGATASAGGPPFDVSGAKNVGNGQGLQFITGQCLNAADCGSGCCAGPSGICSGPGASTQAGKTGCGFVSTGRLVRF